MSEMGITFMPEYRDPYHNRTMTRGEIGCFLSHYEVWQKVVSNNQDAVIVLEDDIRFEPFFREKILDLMKEIETLDWDLIYLGRKRLKEDEEWVAGYRSLVRVAYSYWTLGYLLTYRGAQRLLQPDPLSKLIPVDEYIPIMFDNHPEDSWKAHFPVRNLVAFSVAPFLLYPTHYTGEKGYISDTENSITVAAKDNQRTREDL